MSDNADAIVAHVAMIATYIRDMNVPPERQRKIAANVRDAILLALKEMPA
jgi:hypothetical protein